MSARYRTSQPPPYKSTTRYRTRPCRTVLMILICMCILWSTVPIPGAFGIGQCPCSNAVNIDGLTAFYNETGGADWKCGNPSSQWNPLTFETQLCGPNGIPMVTCEAGTGSITSFQIVDCALAGTLPQSAAFLALENLTNFVIMSRSTTTGTLLQCGRLRFKDGTVVEFSSLFSCLVPFRIVGVLGFT